jgi:tetratricopeptide (TPR) repeat protein
VKGGNREGKIIFFFLCALVLELYGYSTLLRNFEWTNQRTLWQDAVAKSPGKARPYNGLGLALVLQDRLEEAKRNFQHAITLEPRGGPPYLNLGYVYRMQGNWDKAIEFYEMSIPLNPKLVPEIYNSLGFAYLAQGKMKESKEYLRRSVEMRPHSPAPYYNFGLFFEKEGNIDQAISCQEKANRLDPDYGLPYEALSRLYSRKGWRDKSQEAYQNFLKYSSKS